MTAKKRQDKWWFFLALAILTLGIASFVTILVTASGRVAFFTASVTLVVAVLVAVVVVLKTLNRSVQEILDNM